MKFSEDILQILLLFRFLVLVVLSGVGSDIVIVQSVNGVAVGHQLSCLLHV